MESSLTAHQLLRQLRKEEQDWRSYRWLCLLVSLIPIVGNLYAVWKFDTLMQLSRSMFGEKSFEAGFYLAIGASVALILASFGALGLTHVIKNWRGNRTRQLLIILMAERQIETEKISLGSRPKEF